MAFLTNSPVLSGLISVLLMWIDWLLSVAQEREMRAHYSKHYQSYPVNTTEGNPMLQKDIAKKKLLSIKHVISSIAVGILVFIALKFIPAEWWELFLGYVWGLFIIVITQHLSNLIGYIAGRRGLHGKLWMHQRTGFITQSGRYFSTFLMILVLALLTESQFIAGMTVATLTSAIRQLIWIGKVPMITEGDPPPDLTGVGDRR